jgi:hypothetical protein
MRKISRIIIPIFLVIVVCYLTNSTINQHLHKLSSGLVVQHSHPFDKGNTGTPFQKHHHTSSELLLLDKISSTVFWIYLFILFFIPLLLADKITNSPLVITFKNPDLYFLRNYHAPPENSY